MVLLLVHTIRHSRLYQQVFKQCPHLLVPVDGGKERRQPVTVHLTVRVEEEYHVSPRFLGPGCASADQASSLLVPDEAYKSIPAGDVVL